MGARPHCPSWVEEGPGDGMSPGVRMKAAVLLGDAQGQQTGPMLVAQSWGDAKSPDACSAERPPVQVTGSGPLPGSERPHLTLLTLKPMGLSGALALAQVPMSPWQQIRSHPPLEELLSHGYWDLRLLQG